MTKYKDTEFLKEFNTKQEPQIDFMEDTVAAYENFIQFLKNPESEINHE